MLKELIISIIVVVIVCVASYFVQQYLTESSDSLIYQLEELKEQIKEAQETGEKEKASSTSQEVLETWKNTQEVWAALIVHEELDLIELSLLGVNASVETKSFDDGLQEIDKSIYLVGHIKEKEVFALKNIF